MSTNDNSNLRLKVAIVENETEEANKLKISLIEYGLKNNITFNIFNYASGIEFNEKKDYQFDCIFLDILMPSMNGIELANQIRKINNKVEIIFVTNMANYALKGYEVNAFDFIIKPFNKVHLFQTLDKLINVIKAKVEKNITLKNGSNIKVVALSSITYIEIESHLIIYHFIDGKEFDCWGNLNAELNKLDESFLKPNQKTIVNLKYIDQMNGNEIIIDKKIIQLSRKYKKEVLNKIMAYYNKLV